MEEAKAEQLRKRIAASTGDTLDRQEELLRQLNKEVKVGLTHCRVGCRSANSSTSLSAEELNGRPWTDWYKTRNVHLRVEYSAMVKKHSKICTRCRSLFYGVGGRL